MGGLNVAPPAYVPGQIVTAAQLNDSSDKFNELIGVWQTFNAAVTGVGATVTARYMKVGRTITYRVDFTMTAAPTGGLGMNLPVAARAIPSGVSGVFGVLHTKDVSAGNYAQGIVIADGTGSPITAVRLMAPATPTNTNLSQMSATVPYPFASPDSVSVFGSYEAANL